MSTAAELTGGQFSEQQVVSLVEARAGINVWEGAIRSGKTIASIIAWGRHLDRMRDAEGEPFMIARTRDSAARNVFAPMRSVPLLRALFPGTHYVSGAPTARVLGQEVHVLGANDRQAEEKLRGLTGKSGYADEITVLPAAMFRQANGRLSVDGARLFGTTNPDNPAHWLKTDYLDRPHSQGRPIAPGDETTLDLAQWHFTLDDNPFVNDKYKRNRKAEYTGLWYRRMILGEWVQAEGAIYDMWDPNRHVARVRPDQVERVIGVGVDYGTTNAFSALLLAVLRDGRLAFLAEYRHDSRKALRQLTDAEYSTQLAAWIEEQVERWGGRPRWITVDPSAASFSEQLHRDGVRGVTDADNAVSDGIRLVASLLGSDRLVVDESCAGLIGEAPGYAWDDKAAEKGEDKPIKVADHSLDAARYAIATTQAMWRRQVPLTRWTP